MKKLFVFALCLVAWMTCGAQNYFEGTLKARSYEEHSKMMVKFSKGMLINGARDAEMYVKGKKLAVKDASTNVSTVYNLETMKLYFVFHNIKKVLEMPTAQLEAMMAGGVVPEDTGVNKTLTGLNCRLYHAKKETEENGMKTTIKTDIYLCTELEVDPALAPFVSQNTGLPYIGMKYVVDSNISAPMMNWNSYIAYEIKEVIRGNVDDSLFEVPADYEVVDGSSNSKMLAVYSENNKVMKKNMKGKQEASTEIKFDINEEWDF